MIKIVTTLVLLIVINTNAQEVLPLYKTIPNSKPSANRETVFNTEQNFINNVSVPTLTYYKPAKANAQKSAVIICPGGGYGMLAAGHEGKDVAVALNKMGITAFVLKYRLPSDSIMKDKSIGPLQDAQRALQMVRENAGKWNIDPAKVGILGFSAGGHLAATASTLFDTPVIDNPKKTSLRPDFTILIYPVISFTEVLTHMGSRENLIGKNASQKSIDLYSNELHVNATTPPAFIVHASDDDVVPVHNSIVYYEALLKNKVYSEMLIYPHGGHGFGMHNPTTADKWMDNLKNWLVAGKFL
jgi:acetyl esterase/lipase